MTYSENIMLEAIKCAKQAKLRGEVPVGAIVYNPKTREVVAKSSNQTYDLKYGSINGNINYFQRENTNHLPEIYDNICSESCNKLLTDFFKERR